MGASNKKESISKHQWAGMVPKNFDLQKEELDSVSSSMKDTMEDFEDINRIYFSGGGGVMELQLSIEKSYESHFKPGNPNAQLSKEAAMQKLENHKRSLNVVDKKKNPVDIDDISFKEKRDKYVQNAAKERTKEEKKIISSAEKRVKELIEEHDEKVKKISNSLAKSDPKIKFQQKAKEICGDLKKDN